MPHQQLVTAVPFGTGSFSGAACRYAPRGLSRRGVFPRTKTDAVERVPPGRGRPDANCLDYQIVPNWVCFSKMGLIPEPRGVTAAVSAGRAIARLHGGGLSARRAPARQAGRLCWFAVGRSPTARRKQTATLPIRAARSRRGRAVSHRIAAFRDARWVAPCADCGPYGPIPAHSGPFRPGHTAAADHPPRPTPS